MIESEVARLGETPFAVIDLETTGLYPGGHDRIVEVAIVRTDPRGAAIDEYATLVNPRRDVGPTPIHGIMAEDVVHAPTFEEIVGDVVDRLDGAIVAAHNLRFDLRFLEAELTRCGLQVPPLPAICTLDLAFRICPDLPSRKLGWCCEEAGILHEDEHSALGDARATAALLGVYLERASRRGWRALPELGCEVRGLPHSSWRAAVRPSGRCLCRSGAAEKSREERTYLARLVQRMAGADAGDARTAEYMALLDRALEDRIVTHAEAEGLVSAAVAWGMAREDVLGAHRVYLSSLVEQALADGIVTAVERRDLEAVSDMLGLHRAALDAMLSARKVLVPVASSTSVEDLAGKTVCFTGELSGRIGGEPITREQAAELATGAGLIVQAGVTKKLDVLVCADPHSQSGKAKKARDYRVRIMAEPAFWRAIGVAVE